MSNERTGTFAEGGAHKARLAPSAERQAAIGRRSGGGSTGIADAVPLPPAVSQALTQFRSDNALRDREWSPRLGSGAAPSGVTGKQAVPHRSVEAAGSERTWRMPAFCRNLLIAATASVALAGCVDGGGSDPATGESASIHIPRYFYGDSLGTCDTSRSGKKISFADPSVEPTIAAVVGYDWSADHARGSDSLTVRHDKISYPMRYLFAATHAALTSGNSDEIQKALSLVTRIAEANTLLDTMTFAEAIAHGEKCYRGRGDTSARCLTHAPQFATIFSGNYLVSAILLKPEMTEEQRETVDAYVRTLHDRYIRPWADSSRRSDRGFYEMANGGIAELAYAAWAEDRRLAARVFERTFLDIDRKFYTDGYINNNSFRGVRALWYHSLGVNASVTMLGLAEAWRAPVRAGVPDKIASAVALINVGIRDLKKFESRSFFGYRGNASTDPNHARTHVHQLGIAFDATARRYAGVTLERDPDYLRKRKNEGPSDWTVGFHPGCMVRQ